MLRAKMTKDIGAFLQSRSSRRYKSRLYLRLLLVDLQILETCVAQIDNGLVFLPKFRFQQQTAFLNLFFRRKMSCSMDSLMLVHAAYSKAVIKHISKNS